MPSDLRFPSSRARSPLANGTANEVPDNRVAAPGTDMASPGAKTETESFRVLKALSLRFMSIEATEMAASQALGNS